MKEVRELGADWAAEDIQTRRDAALSPSVILSMPPGTSHVGVRDAARTFAAEMFGDRFDYAFSLHTDADHPHVHLAVRMLGQDGERLNPRKADLDHWRQTFARTLRDRGIAAEATPRRARGVVRKPETMTVRKLREKQERGVGKGARVLHAAREGASRIARGELRQDRPWEVLLLKKRREVRMAYLRYADALEHGDDEAKALARELRTFVRAMPEPTTLRNELVRAARLLQAERQSAEALHPSELSPRRRR